MKKIISIFFLLMANFIFGEEKIKIGVTLQPYYSFVSNVVKEKGEVVPTVRLDIYDSHNYQPKAEDIQNFDNLDILVVNGIGHDEFIFDILNSSKNKDKIKVIYANKDIPLMPVSGTLGNEKVLNPHTFISITSAIQQVYNIAKELGNYDPANKKYYLDNARAYAQKLRKLKTDALKEISDYQAVDFRVATLHGGYDYLFSEFGIEVKAVIEPFHGVQPSAADIEKVIKKIKDEKIQVIFGEKAFDSKVVNMINKETGVKVMYLSHLTNGGYTQEGFEEFIKINLDEIVKGIQTSNLKKGKVK